MSAVLRLRSVGSGLRCAKRTLALSSVSGQKSEFGSKSKAATTKAVVFDMGGVIIPSPLPYLRAFESHLDLPSGTLARVVMSGGDNGAWQRMERGEIGLREFAEKFSQEVASLSGGKQIDMSHMMGGLMGKSDLARPYPEMLDAIKCLRAEGIKTALLTNNFANPSGGTFQPLDENLFDVIIESAKVKMRKPEARIYQYTLEKLQVVPQETVFLDDLGENLKAAKQLGFRTIKVKEPKEAIRELEAEVGFQLSGYMEGTSRVPDRLKIPLDKLKSYLNSTLNLHDSGDPVVRCFEHGQSNPTYFVSYGNKSMVLRKKPPGKLLPSAHAVEREYLVMKSLKDHGVPVPAMLGLCEDSSVLGTPFYIMEHVPGRIFKDPLLPELSKEERREIYLALCDNLVKIHKVSIKDAGLENYGKQGQFVKRNFTRWAKQYEASKTGDVPAMDELMKWLTEHMPTEEACTIIHGDFRLDNLIFHPTKPVVVAVIDWELSTLGDPLTDLANTCMKYYLKADTGILPSFQGVDLQSLGIPSVEELVNRYTEQMNIPGINQKWSFYVVFICFRMAAILQGVYKRFTLGFKGVDLQSHGIPTVEELVKHYTEQMNIPSIAQKWSFYMAFNCFRAVAVLQGVYKRFTLGQASSPTAEMAGLAVDMFANLGLEIASKQSLLGGQEPAQSSGKHQKPNLFGPTSGGSKKYSTLASRSDSSSVEPSKTSGYSERNIGTMTSNSNSGFRIPSAHEYSTSQERNIPGGLALSVSALSPRCQDIYKRVKAFITEHVLPLELEYYLWSQDPKTKWTIPPKMEELKAKAKAEGLWNLFLPKESDPEGKLGAGLTNLEYAFIAEEMGRSFLGSEPFNCSAPDTGNIEVLVRYGTEEQKEKWLKPLLEGKIRSCFSMTEPAVASSDATNIQASIRREGNEYVINGHKWWSSGAMDPRCKIIIFMGKTNPGSAIHQQQSMILVPMDAPGVKVLRALKVFGYDDAPHGHAEILFENVRVPASNLLLGEGRGFEIAQGRLGPGRIHHCMRTIGMAERALALMVNRAQNRVAFGKPLAQQSSIQQDIAKARIEIEQSRLLVLKAAYMMDVVGNKVAAPEIAMIKASVPDMACRIIDKAIQVHGGMGLCQDTELAPMYSWARVLRIADGPDEVHYRAIAKMELRTQNLAKL